MICLVIVSGNNETDDDLFSYDSAICDTDDDLFSDGSGNNDTDDVLVTIRQDTNQAPIAKILQPGKNKFIWICL